MKQKDEDYSQEQLESSASGGGVSVRDTGRLPATFGRVSRLRIFIQLRLELTHRYPC